MRPRSRPQAKRGLPTIREGYEELVQDMNQANSRHLPAHGQAQSLSTHDYVLSICQLARPTFPRSEPDCDILAVGSLASLGPCLRLHRPRNPVPPRQPLVCQVGRRPQPEQEDSRGEGRGLEREVGVSSGRTTARGLPSVSDPLEYLYGHGEALHATAVHSHSSQGWRDEGRESTWHRAQPPIRTDIFPGVCSLPPTTPQKISCPELSLVDPAELEKLDPDIARPQTVSSEQRIPDASSSLTWRFQNNLNGVSAGERGKCPCYLDQHTVVSSWIAECRSAWRDARIRACMLPAIAEM